MTFIKFMPLFVSLLLIPTSAFAPVTRLPVQSKGNRHVHYASKQHRSQDLVDKFNLNAHFGRWRFLQGIIEGDIGGREVNEMLYIVLRSFVDHPRPRKTKEGLTNPSPSLTDDQKHLLLDNLFQVQENGYGTILALPTDDEEFNVHHEETFKLLERLQPDPVENEDDFKSCWDILTEMYGRESTKMAQTSGSLDFKYRSNIVRLLLYFDFLTEGVGE